MSTNFPTLDEVHKPINEVVAAILQHVDYNLQRNPFSVRVTNTGMYGGENAVEDVSIENPNSLNHDGYTVDYNYGVIDEEYQRQSPELPDARSPETTPIAHIIRMPDMPNVSYISWNAHDWTQLSRSREGFGMLEQLLKEIENTNS